MTNQSDSFQDIDNLDIAIVGLAGRFPGARNIAEFWRNLQNGVESISFFSEQELSARHVDPALLANANYVKAASLLADIALFDASFFGYSPREAELMDPQHRILLECAWEALEDAGFDAETYGASTGVFVGTSGNTYVFNLYSNRELIDTVGATPILVANDKDYLATRISYKMNLRGPSYSIQTSCSTSQVAVHIACQALLNYECDMALAGGVSIRTSEHEGYMYQENGVLSPDGHCRAFDAAAQGTIFGSGVGVVVLKRMSDALKDNDMIYAVVKGSSTNNDGSFKVGYTAPSVAGQAAVIAEALSVAKVHPETISYIEAHGTGTQLGDPVEIEALTQVFQNYTNKKGFCAIGSVKTNIGHLDAAAGISGLIKTVLALKHECIPPSLHFERPNPQIDFANSPFYVNAALSKWQRTQAPRRAGVSSFGFGGTNAHVILEEAPVREPSDPARPWHLLLLSARTSSSLEAMTANLHEYLLHNPEIDLADCAYTLQVGRKTFNHRRALVCADREDALALLSTKDPARVSTAFPKLSDQRSIAFLFPNQGTQYQGMGWELYQHEPLFRETVDRCAELLRPHLGLDIRDVIYPPEPRMEDGGWRMEDREPAILHPPSSILDQTQYTQPALFVVEYALAALWRHWGVEPGALVGQGLGEYVAACLAEVLTLEQALRLVVARGRAMQSQPPTPALGAGQASHAPQLAALRAQLERERLQPPRIPFVSSVTGAWITAAQATDPAYWIQQFDTPVRFSDALTHLLRTPDQILIEVGPGQTLSSLARQHPALGPEHVVLESLPAPRERRSDCAFLLMTIGKLWLQGVSVNWQQFYADEKRHRISLPTYPFERQHYWIAPRVQPEGENLPRAAAAKRADSSSWYYVPTWRGTKQPRSPGAAVSEQPRACWLVFADAYGLGARLARRLTAEKHDVVSVMAGERFNRVSERVYTINPRDPAHYMALLKELAAAKRYPDSVLHLWSITPSSSPQIDDLQKIQDLGFYSLLFIAQAIGEQGITSRLQLQVITNQLQNVEHNDPVVPEKTTILGPCRVIPQEYPFISCRCLDIIVPSPGDKQERVLLDQIKQEAGTQVFDPLVVYRGTHRWVRSFEPVELPDPPEELSLLKTGGVYLITGGLGGIGFVLAEYLARTLRAKLILVGRTSLPHRSEWQHWLSRYGEDDAVSRKIQKVHALENHGTEVFAASANIADEAQLRQVIDQARERFGPINGVIHAAGVAGKGMMQFKSPDAASQVLEPKVQGTIAIYNALKQSDLDFIMLCSSHEAITGNVGQADYCAANAFLDTFAERRADEDTLIVSVNWDVWRDVGMAVETDIPAYLRAFREERLKQGIRLEEGVEVFRRILNSRQERVVVSTRGIDALTAPSADAATPYGAQAPDAAMPPPTMHGRPQLQTAFVAPELEFEQLIAGVWQQALGIEQIGIDDNFFDLGGDSLIAVQAITSIKQMLQVELPTISLYQKPTIRLLAEFIYQHVSLTNDDHLAIAADRSEAMSLRKQYQQRQRDKKRS